jgi:hypothetical protein
VAFLLPCLIKKRLAHGKIIVSASFSQKLSIRDGWTIDGGAGLIAILTINPDDESAL